MYWKETAIAILILLLTTTTIYWQKEVREYKQTTQQLQKAMQEKNIPTEQPQKEQPKQIEKIIEKEITKEKEPDIKTRTTPVLAYNRQTQKGIVGYVEISTIPGKGDILIDVRPFNSPDVQKSTENAVKAAMKEAKLQQIPYKDIKIKFYIDSEAVGGNSAGLPIALATLALLQNKQLKKEVAATGTIDEKGNIGKVGGILQKAEAASKKGIRTFLIPRGEGEITATTPHYLVDATGKRIEKLAPVTRKINAIHEARSRWNIDLQQTATLTEAKKYAFTEQV